MGYILEYDCEDVKGAEENFEPRGIYGFGKVEFLDKNGTDYERAEAREAGINKGDIFTIKECRVGEWVSYYTFEEIGGKWNSVMFDRTESPYSTNDLVADFMDALGDKLHQADMKYGHGESWKQDDWEEICRSELYRHLKKGDPRDVAAYCAFMWYHGWSTKTPISKFNPDKLFNEGWFTDEAKRRNEIDDE